MIASVSNIAWAYADELPALQMLVRSGIRHLEVAPTKFWSDLNQVTERPARELAESLQKLGLQVCGFQALLFGKPDLQLFGENDGEACRAYLAKICRLAGWMGAKTLVFGSPKNRLRGGLSLAEANRRAGEFFRRLGDEACANGTVVCLEPNPAVYGGDFLQTCDEAATLVVETDSPGVRLNLDMGELILNEADVSASLERFLPLTGHFHVSEPMLAPLDPTQEGHRTAARVLRDEGYKGAVSLEMKIPAEGMPVLTQAVQDMLRTYFPPAS